MSGKSQKWFLLFLLLLLIAAVPFLFVYVRGAKATSGAVTGSHHYFYTFPNGQMNVYDMDNNFALVQNVAIPTTNVRGVVFDPTSGMLYISNGGDGGQNGNGSLIKYNLLTESVVWTQNYNFGVDSLAISGDGKTIYLPDGAASTDGLWYIINASTGAVMGNIPTVPGGSPHDGDMGDSGKFVYFGDVNNNFLRVVSTATNKVVQTVGPLKGGVRPFVINKAETMAFTTATNFLGFEVSSLITGKVLYTVPVNGFTSPPSFPAGLTPSHGITLSPDEKTVYVIDTPNNMVHAFNVSGLPNVAPTQIANIPVSTFSGNESPCTYDCSKEGWLVQSLDGRYVFVGNSGDIIDTTVQKVVKNLPTLADTRMFLEIDWTNGTPTATTDRYDYYGGVTTPPTPPPNTPPGPVNKTWYFAEGRVGKGFREYLSIENPSANACAVNIQYNYTPDGGTPANKTVSVTVNPFSRLTESVNNDLGYADSSGTGAILAAVVNVNGVTTPGCNGVVVERPIYFVNFGGIASGTDVLGATHLNTTFYFANVPTGPNNTSFLTILNPNNVPANVTVTYYVNGAPAGTQSVTVPANARGTIAPKAINLPANVAAIVQSNQPVMVERPTYFINASVNGNTVSGAYDIVGSPVLAGDWLFAEGYTGASTQEYLTIANLDPTKATAAVKITLKSKTGATQSFNLTLTAAQQVIWNVNANNNFAGSSPEVSAEVTSTGGNIIVQREMYFTYSHTLTNGRVTNANGGTDVIGQVGPAAHSSYSFAEGYANTGYNDWLTIQNPTTNAETITITIVNGLGQSNVQTVTVPANARFTEDIASLVQSVFNAGTNSNANSFSMTVQALNGAVFVAERPTYFNTNGLSGFGVQGGGDIIGYVGG
jgi:hypothetical protein